MQLKKNVLNILVIICGFLVLLLIFILQSINPFLYECDAYYHIKVPCFIREYGIHYNFQWAQFSTFKNTFSDKEWLFHILAIPFTFIGKDFHFQVNIAVLFFAFVFLYIFIFVQKKYVLKPILIFSILSLPLSIYFLSYINYLRPKTLAMTFLLIYIYFLTDKKWLLAFMISILYALTHISFIFVIILALGIEILRYIHSKEFYVRNILYSILGIFIGIYIHPDFPNNLASIHLNAILVPWNTMFGNLRLDYGLEWNPITTQSAFKDLFIFFTGAFFAILLLLTKNIKINFHTITFFFTASFFLFLSMFSLCYWYFMYPFGLIFLAMLFSDYLKSKPATLKYIFTFSIGLILIFRAYLVTRENGITNMVLPHIEMNSHYERVANWMNKHIPPGEIIYHTSWSDSPYFICINPKDYYLNVLDPIYMYYYSPKIYSWYTNLSNGNCIKPAKALKKIFRARYAYVSKNYGLYNQIYSKKNFKTLFEDDRGAVFMLQ